jgi:hypothetical protein
MWPKYICTILIACVVSAVCSSANAQITSSGKKFRFVRIGKLEENLRIQAELNYTKHGDDISFERGHLILGFRIDGNSSKLADLRFDYQQDILRFIELVDELYQTPLGENDNLELELKPTIPNGTWYVGTTLAFQKRNDGYWIWHPGWGEEIFGGNGSKWMKIDLVVFRESLAEVARVTIVDEQIPKLPEAMKTDAEKASSKIWDPMNPTKRDIPTGEKRIENVETAPVEWPVSAGGNGHFYQAVAAPGSISWGQAQDAAKAAGGYLATMTSKAENDFVFGLVDHDPFWTRTSALFGPWIGAVQKPGSREPDGGWTWITGERFVFANWDSQQPNEWHNANENRIIFGLGQDRTRAWCDVQEDHREISSYVIEWDIDPSKVSSNNTPSPSK